MLDTNPMSDPVEGEKYKIFALYKMIFFEFGICSFRFDSTGRAAARTATTACPSSTTRTRASGSTSEQCTSAAAPAATSIPTEKWSELSIDVGSFGNV